MSENQAISSMKNQPATNQQGCIRLPAVAKMLGIGKSTILRWITEGKFPQGIKFGERIRVWKIADVQAFIDKAEAAQEA